MPILNNLLSTLRRPFRNEHEEFMDHIRKWVPVASIIGFAVGIVMAMFFISISLISRLISPLPGILPMVIGSIWVLFLIKVGFESTSNNGINYVIEKKHEQSTVPIAEVKEFFTSGIALGSGLPVGKEGPALIIGSAIACKIAELFKINDDEWHDAITIGSAAATGALFQAPLGAAVFASEVPYKQDSDEPVLMIAFLASVIGAITMKSIIELVNTRLFKVDLNIFDIGEASLDISWQTTLLALILGFIVGLFGLLFINLYYGYKKRIRHLSPNMRVVSGVLIMIIVLSLGGLVIPDLYLLAGISSFGAIETFIQQASRDFIWIMILSLIIQIIATTALIGSGFPGGIFGPSLAVGAILGISFAVMIGTGSREEITAYAIIGMSASHAATTKTPVASVLLILEITGLPHLIIPVVIANIAAYVTSGPRSLYDKQIHSREIDILRELSQYDQLEEFKVSDVMTGSDELVCITSNSTLNELKDILKRTEKNTIPVIHNDRCIGVVTPEDLGTISEDLDTLTVDEIMSRDVITVNPWMSAREAMYVFIDKDVERCPVLDKNEKICGIVSMKDILQGHRKTSELKRQYFR